MTLIHKIFMILALWGLYGELEKKNRNDDTSVFWMLIMCFVILSVIR